MTGARRRRAPRPETHGPDARPLSSPDTICALATPPGRGSIAVVRVSGPETFALLDRFILKDRASRQPSHSLRLAWFGDAQGKPTDQVMTAVFRSPRSYTGEDMAEISCHGGQVSADTILELLLAAGCRLARPGEFTRRAVLNGKMTLTQAEAVAEMVEARTRDAYEAALKRYRGLVPSPVSRFRSELEDLLARAEYALGMDETDSTPATPAATLKATISKLDRLLASGERNRFLVDGAKVVIVGRPNAGKSSLFNLLLEQERAITSPRPGTTRDRVDATLVLAGVPVRLSDTAGMVARAGTSLSRLAIQQTRRALDEAHLVVAVFDGSAPAGPADRAVAESLRGRTCIKVLNKCDRPRRLDPAFVGRQTGPCVTTSCRTGQGLSRLRRAVARVVAARPGPTPSLAELDALRACRTALAAAVPAPTPETAALEIRAALGMLSQLDSPVASEDILDRVFSRFCVGK